MSTPRELGFRMPAEWALHRATWLGWPHNRGDWPGKLAPIPWVYGEIVRKLAPGEQICILINSPAHQAQASRVLRRVGVDMEAVEFCQFPTNRGWTRDFGPFFVRRERPQPEVAIARFHFNAWAKYPDWELDCQVPLCAAQQRGLPLFEARRDGQLVVLEGGSIDVNGEGLLLTTEECLLDSQVQVRNPQLGRGELEGVLREYLGAEQVVWLGRGIAGDDTHGHVDDLCRFVNARTVVLAHEPDGDDANHRPLEENRERLEGFRLRDGGRLEVVRLPMPAPLYLDGQRLPASYANFYIGNSAVLVPTFNDSRDRQAMGILAELFPDRQVLGIHAVDLVWGLGTLHCLTQQEPAI